MFIAMNRFRVKKGSEDVFEKVWLGRDTYLDRIPGFLEFHLLKGPEAEDYTPIPRTACGRASGPSRRGPSRKNFGPRTRVPATRQLGRSIWSILNLRASRYARLSQLVRRRRCEPQSSRHHPRVSLSSLRQRRRSDRITSDFAAVAHVRKWHKADIPVALTNVRFWGVKRKSIGGP